MSIKLLPRERYLRTARPSRGNRGGPARRGSRCYELGKLLSDVPACRAIGSITEEDRSVGDIRAHRDLRSVPGAADLIEIEGCGKVPLSVDLRFQIGDLLLRSGNGVGTRDEAARRWLLARDGDECSRKLGRITGLQAILGFPKLELLRSALVVVLDGWLGVVRRLLREEFRAEEPRVDDGGSDPEWRDLGVQRLHPALQAELRRGVGANELEAGGEAR